MATVDDVRYLGTDLERSYEVYVRDRLKFRVKQIVYGAERIGRCAGPLLRSPSLRGV